MRIERFELRASDVCTDAHGIAYPIDWELQIFDSPAAPAPFMVAHVRPVLKEQALSSLVMPDYWRACALSTPKSWPGEQYPCSDGTGSP
jgi:hypothetical protein